MNNRPTYMDAGGFKNEAEQAFGPQVKGWDSVLDALSPNNVCQECATANSSKNDDTQSEHESSTATSPV
jgi:hypothetical protein